MGQSVDSNGSIQLYPVQIIDHPFQLLPKKTSGKTKLKKQTKLECREKIAWQQSN